MIATLPKAPLNKAFPQNWELLPLAKCVSSDVTYGIVQCGPHQPNGVPYIRTGDMRGSRLKVAELQRTSPEIAAKFGRSRIRTGEIVMAIRATVGKVLEVPPELEGANLTQGTARIAPSDGVLGRYLLYCLRSPWVQEQIDLMTKGTTFREITLADIRELCVPIPPLPEQRTIAEALGDVDALIAAQEKLIAKKRAIKTATMQRLLTGKQRLPGFGEGCGYKQTEIGVIPEDWSVSSLIEFGTQAGGTTPPRAQYERYYSNGVHNWVKTLDLNNSEINGTDERVTDAALQETSLRIFPEGTILVAMYGGFQQIGRTGLLKQPAATNQAISAIIPNPKLAEPRFVLEWLNFRVAYWKNVASSSRKDPNITSRDVAKFPLPRPELGEQRAIAKVLQDVDAELEALKTRLAKTKAIKQGMMQELLTGRTRLV